MESYVLKKIIFKDYVKIWNVLYDKVISKN